MVQDLCTGDTYYFSHEKQIKVKEKLSVTFCGKNANPLCIWENAGHGKGI